MEKPIVKSKNKTLKFLPKALSFQNLLLPDLNHHRSKTQINKGFSGQIPSMIPADARRKTRNIVVTELEPTSPKVSCVGQIKCPTNISLKSKDSNTNKKKKEENKKKKKKGFFGKGATDQHAPPLSHLKKSLGMKGAVDQHAPRLGQLRKFASNRETLSGFDWTAVELQSDDEDSFDDNDGDVSIPFSAPMLVGMEPKKESNLWKRRAMAKPNSVQLQFST